MVDKIKTHKLVIKYNGIFDFKGLYKVMHDWISYQGFYFEETLYKHKVPSPAGAEEHMKWENWIKVNEYVKYWIRVYFILMDMKEVEVIKNGEKTKLIKARMQIEIYGEVELDWKKRFGGSKTARKLKDFLDKYIYGHPTEGMIGSIWWDELYYRTIKLQTVAKEFLDMEAKGNAYYDMW